MSPLIGRIVVQPPVPQPGATVRVEVLGSDEAGPDQAIADVPIHGIPGSVQFLQFPSSGLRKLLVVARSKDGQAQTEIATVDVQGPPVKFKSLRGKEDIAMVSVTQSAQQPYEAVLTLGSFIDVRTPPPKSQGLTVAPPRIAMALKDLRLTQRKPATALSAMFEASARRPLQVQSRRLTRLVSRRCKGPAHSKDGAAPATKSVRNLAAARTMVSAVYDLGNLDVGKVLGGKGESGHGPKQEYAWDFGDGTTAVTRTPTVRHDYFPAIDHGHGTGQFVVSCTARHSGVSVKRTLTIQSAYKLCKLRGTIVPHVISDLYAHKRYWLLSSSFVAYNVEADPLVLDRMSVTALPENPDAPALPRPYVALEQPIVVPPSSNAVVGVNIPFIVGTPGVSQLAHDVKGFTVLYAGHCGDAPVRCSVVFDVPVTEWSVKPSTPVPGDVPDLEREPWPWEIVERAINQLIREPDSTVAPEQVLIDRRTGTVAVAHSGLDPAPAAARDRILRLLDAVYVAHHDAAQSYRQNRSVHAAQFRKRTSSLAVPRPLFGSGRSMQALTGGPPEPGAVTEGAICDPDNLDEDQLDQADQQQLVCQRTDEVMEVLMPARWMNARKGDVILSPGGEGIIGGLMLNVTPEQWYSHSGIMTRNFDEITHSTGSQARLMDHLRGIADGSDGFEPQILKYIWPGAITQTVENSIDGEPFPDPEYDKTYSVSAFGPLTVGVTHNDQMKMIPPLVLKPDPMQETPAVRSALHAIATDARADAGRPGMVGKYHYRWYCYTDPAIGQGAPEGSDAGWATGTHPSVCSSYIWLHARSRMAKLESGQPLVTPTDLEPSDVAGGAAVRPVTQEGLYMYAAAERRTAGEWLYNTIYNQAYDKAGWLGNILTDAADDISNQFLNAFASDDTDGKDSDAWRQTRDADAVSPDDMMWWDGPDRGGLYGYVEPAKFRETRVETYTVSRWKKVLSRGDVHGRVFDAGQPVAGAIVQVYEGKTDFTDGAGQYELADVPLGDYQLKASKVIDSVLKAAQVNLSVNAADVTVDLTLQAPPERYRIAQLFIDFWGRDEETWADDEIHDPGPEYFELYLGPDKLINTAYRTYRWGGEMRVEYSITVRLLVNNTIDVEVQGLLYEGTSEDTTDLDGTGSTTFQVGVGATAGATLTITNTQEDDADEGQLSISVKNVRNSA